MFPLLPLIIAFHTITSPYTKVEESFTLHAVRDLLIHGRDIGQVCSSSFPVGVLNVKEVLIRPGVV